MSNTGNYYFTVYTECERQPDVILSDFRIKNNQFGVRKESNWKSELRREVKTKLWCLTFLVSIKDSSFEIIHWPIHIY